MADPLAQTAWIFCFILFLIVSIYINVFFYLGFFLSIYIQHKKFYIYFSSMYILYYYIFHSTSILSLDSLLHDVFSLLSSNH